MEVLPLSPQPVTIANRQNPGGVRGFVQAAPLAPDPVSTAPRAPGVTAAKDLPSSSQVAQAVRQVNDAFAQKGLNLYASFEKDKISGVTIVKIVEKKSNEVIRQLPPQEMVAFAQSLDLPEGWRGQWIRNMS
jgi:flagellar protein FlaG